MFNWVNIFEGFDKTVLVVGSFALKIWFSVLAIKNNCYCKCITRKNLKAHKKWNAWFFLMPYHRSSSCLWTHSAIIFLIIWMNLCLLQINTKAMNYIFLNWTPAYALFCTVSNDWDWGYAELRVSEHWMWCSSPWIGLQSVTG